MNKNFQHLIPWSERMQGARLMLHFLVENYHIDLASDITKKQGKQIYHQAIYKWLLDDLSHIDHFLSGEPIFFTGHEKDPKGNLIKCVVVTKDPRK